MLIEKVEIFQESNKRLPGDLTELKINERLNALAFYRKESDSTYVVWYGEELGESKIYSSISATWD